MTLSSKSLIDLQKMTKDQLISAITAGRTESKVTLSEGDERGQLRQSWETRDLAGNLVGTREILWTYYPNGNVDTITTINRDATGKEVSRQIVKHGKDGGIIKTQ